MHPELSILNRFRYIWHWHICLYGKQPHSILLYANRKLYMNEEIFGIYFDPCLRFFILKQSVVLWNKKKRKSKVFHKLKKLPIHSAHLHESFNWTRMIIHKLINTNVLQGCGLSSKLFQTSNASKWRMT